MNIGDHVTVVGSDELASVTSLGSNYVIIESNGKLYRKWLSDIELVEKMTNRQDPDIKDAPGSQPAGYYAGVKTKTKKRRMNVFIELNSILFTLQAIDRNTFIAKISLVNTICT